MKRQKRMRVGALVAAFGAFAVAGGLLTVSGHDGVVREVVTMNAKDAAGMTRGEVTRLGDEGQLELLGERYHRMQELLTPVQKHVSIGVWKWNDPGMSAYPGPLATDQLAGATVDNAYYMEMTRSIRPAGARGQREDAIPAFDFLVAQGLDAQLAEVPDELSIGAHEWEVRAVTDDGYTITYSVQENGWYVLSVQSRMFWGERDALQGAILYRLPGGAVFPPDEESLPGVYTRFPKWSDPEVWNISMPGNPDAWRQQ